MVGEVQEAPDGVEALKILAAGQCDVLIIDLAIPVLSGLELLEIIGGDKEFRPTEIIVTTGIATESVVRKALELGVDDYILKPYSSRLLEERLLQCVHRLGEKRKAAAESERAGTPRLLVADSDLNFCATTKSVFGKEYHVETAQTGPSLLTGCLQHRPNWVLVSQDLQGMDLTWVVRKLKNIAPHLKVYAMTDKVPSGQPPSDFDGYFEKTFVPERMLAGLRSIVNGHDGLGFGSERWIETVDREAMSAIRQVFGMMTGTEPEAVDDLNGTGGGHFVMLDLTDPNKDFACRCSIGYEKAMALAVCSEMLGVGPDEIGDEDLFSTLNELLNMITGRVKACCDDRGTDMKMGLPQQVEVVVEPADALFSIKSWFRWKEAPPFSFALTGCRGIPS